MNTIKVATFYKFVELQNYSELKQKLLAAGAAQGVKGTILIAHEGINATISATANGLQAFMDYLTAIDEFSDLIVKHSYCDTHPFLRFKVKLKKEIVTFDKTVCPLDTVGEYVKPKDWNALISQKDILLVDTRNDYEVAIGRFKGAVNPNTQTFRDFHDFVSNYIQTGGYQKVAMYCTGGIRCEKSTSYLRRLGIKNVYHLEGGILKYLEEIPQSQSLWEGECFVFDMRVSLDHNLSPGAYTQCHGCRLPLSPEELSSPHYIPGVQCSHCHDKYSQKHMQRVLERQKQIRLSHTRDECHLGPKS